MAPGQPHYCIYPLQGRDGILLQHKRDACRPTVWCWLQGGDLLAMGNQHAGVALALPLLYVSKALFHPMLGSAVVSLVTILPRCSGQKCSDICF